MAPNLRMITVLVITILATSCTGLREPPYEPTDESLKTHPLPDWYSDGKLGIFIHWGLFSVPGWAELSGTVREVVAEHGWEYWFEHCAYAEWFHNTMHIEGSEAQKYHRSIYGSDFPYSSFAQEFNKEITSWNPAEWAKLFKEAGARYVVLTSKHHDGFQLWPSEVTNPYQPNYRASRDLVGELTNAVREEGLIMGLYHSGGYDWTFKNVTIKNMLDLALCIPQNLDYVNYLTGQWKELVEKYRPLILWNDIGIPLQYNARQLFADFYNQNELGVVNNRFDTLNPGFHFDFSTPEYDSETEIKEKKWESTRGFGYGFGYNRNEGESETISAKDLVTSFVDIVSKNGNLLLNVGPMANGTIPSIQVSRLKSLGDWLAINGEAIYGSHYWVVAETQTLEEKIEVRFTLSKDRTTFYFTLLDKPSTPAFTIEHLQVDSFASLRLLGHGSVQFEAANNAIKVAFPPQASESFAYSFALSSLPQWIP